MAEPIWHDDNHFRVGDTNFVVTLDEAFLDASESTRDQFLLVKERGLVEALERLPEGVDSTTDFGTYKGRSSIAPCEAPFSLANPRFADLLRERVPFCTRRRVPSPIVISAPGG